MPKPMSRESCGELSIRPLQSKAFAPSHRRKLFRLAWIWPAWSFRYPHPQVAHGGDGDDGGDGGDAQSQTPRHRLSGVRARACGRGGDGGGGGWP
jgi:hypothetical protein